MPCPLSQDEIDGIVESLWQPNAVKNPTSAEKKFKEWAEESGFEGDWYGSGIVVPDDCVSFTRF